MRWMTALKPRPGGRWHRDTGRERPGITLQAGDDLRQAARWKHIAAVALHAADVGISVESTTDVAKYAADIVLLDKNLGVPHVPHVPADAAEPTHEERLDHRVRRYAHRFTRHEGPRRRQEPGTSASPATPGDHPGGR